MYDRQICFVEMAEVPSLTVDKVFNSADEARAYIDTYNEVKFTNFVVTSNNKKSLTYACRHGVERNSRCRGKRPNHYYNFVGCTVQIRMYKSKSGSVKVTRLDLEHTNHAIN